jgi:hypothetical protein
LQVELLNASTSREIEAAFAAMLRDRADALLVTPDGFFTSRRVQLATFAARYGIPSAHSSREEVEARALSWPEHMRRHVRSWRKLTAHPCRICWSTDRNLPWPVSDHLFSFVPLAIVLAVSLCVKRSSYV